jgi:hypothetical protein
VLPKTLPNTGDGSMAATGPSFGRCAVCRGGHGGGRHRRLHAPSPRAHPGARVAFGAHNFIGLLNGLGIAPSPFTIRPGYRTPRCGGYPHPARDAHEERYR